MKMKKKLHELKNLYYLIYNTNVALKCPDVQIPGVFAISYLYFLRRTDFLSYTHKNLSTIYIKYCQEMC